MSGELISVSANGTSLSNASSDDITFSTKNPFHKLDSTNEKSFQVITIFFNTEPPDPATPTSVATFSDTIVYQFKHGYNYTPSSWFLISLDNFATTLGPEGTILVRSGAVGGTTARLNIYVDDTYVYFHIAKRWGYSYFTSAPDGNPPHVIGLSVSIRAYIFVEDLTGTMVPSHV